MKKLIAVFTAFSLVVSSISYAQNSVRSEATTQAQGQAAAASSYSAVRMSVIIWGVGMAIGIALLTAYIKPNKAS